MKKIQTSLCLPLAVLMMIFSVGIALPVYASGGGGGGGDIRISQESWTLPNLNKKIILSDDEAHYTGRVYFNMKATMEVNGIVNTPMPPVGGSQDESTSTEVPPLAPPPIDEDMKKLTEPIVLENEKAFFIDFNGNEPVVQSCVINPYPSTELEKLVRGMILNLEITLKDKEKQYNMDHGTSVLLYCSGIQVEFTESSGLDAKLIPLYPEKITWTFTPDFRPMNSHHVILTGLDQNTFVNQYKQTTPAKPDTPKPDDTPTGPIYIHVDANATANNNLGGVQGNTQAQGQAPTLDRYNHFAYVNGYPDGTFHPEGSITRAEMTAIFRRLLDQGNLIGNSAAPAFKDVHSGDWYAQDISRLSSMGIVSGYPDGLFRPNASVTRAEFANVASKFVTAKSGQGFNDLSGHWAENAIAKLQSAGLVTGYTDGSFKPDTVITRAEVVTIVDRMLSRVADTDYLQTHAGAITHYSDLSPDYWAYLPIMEASNAHDYTRTENGHEHWTRNWK